MCFVILVNYPKREDIFLPFITFLKFRLRYLRTRVEVSLLLAAAEYQLRRLKRIFAFLDETQQFLQVTELFRSYFEKVVGESKIRK